MQTIVIFKASNGAGWHYAPKRALDNPALVQALRFSDEEGFPTAEVAAAAVAQDQSCAGCDVEIESDDSSDVDPNEEFYDGSSHEGSR